MVIPKISTVRSTISTFSNWPECLARAAAGYYLNYFPSAIPWRTRRGTALVTPAGDQSWWAILESFALDSYDLAHSPLLNIEEPFVIDIGGNIGAFSLAVLERMPSAKGISIEPGSLAFSWLEKNIKCNGAQDAIKCINAAVVGDNGPATLRLFEKPTATGGSTLVPECTNESREPERWPRVAGQRRKW